MRAPAPPPTPHPTDATSDGNTGRMGTSSRPVTRPVTRRPKGQWVGRWVAPLRGVLRVQRLSKGTLAARTKLSGKEGGTKLVKRAFHTRLPPLLTSLLVMPHVAAAPATRWGRPVGQTDPPSKRSGPSSTEDAQRLRRMAVLVDGEGGKDAETLRLARAGRGLQDAPLCAGGMAVGNGAGEGCGHRGPELSKFAGRGIAERVPAGRHGRGELLGRHQTRERLSCPM